MALNVHVTRIDELNPIILEAPAHTTSATQGHPQVIFNDDYGFDFSAGTREPAFTLVNVPDDHNIRKFPVRIFNIPDEAA